LSCPTIIDLSTRWLEIIHIHETTAENTALLFDRSWLCCYPHPTSVIHDAGTEFGQEFAELLSSIGIQEVTTTVKNPCANAILERVHAVIGDMLQTYDFENQKLNTFGKDRQDPFDGFLASVPFACRATYQTSIRTSPASMVFQRDMFFPTKYVANWRAQAQNRKS
jgi:transposase InsO family protein